MYGMPQPGYGQYPGYPQYGAPQGYGQPAYPVSQSAGADGAQPQA